MMKRAGGIASLIYVLSLGFISQALAGGKAEPLRIQFKHGSTSAIVKGHLSGDEQFETVVAAQPGQWLMVEVVSRPLDAAVFIINDTHGHDTTPQYRWLAKVVEPADYPITIQKSADYQSCDFTLKVTLGPRPAPVVYSATDKDGVALNAAMRKFINAVQNKDRAAFLSCFSRSRPSHHLNPLNIGSRKDYRKVVPYSELAREMRQKKGLYWTYLERGESGELDALVDNVLNGQMWTRVQGNRFVPPGAEITSPTYIKWRKEGKRWVIDEISYAHT